jgi:hypothetical protein
MLEREKSQIQITAKLAEIIKIARHTEIKRSRSIEPTPPADTGEHEAIADF